MLPYIHQGTNTYSIHETHMGVFGKYMFSMGGNAGQELTVTQTASDHMDLFLDRQGCYGRTLKVYQYSVIYP